MSMSKITHIVLHYSATFEDQNLTVKDIDKMHKARGWKGVGYHYVIRRDGKVEVGRPEFQTGAHVGGQNSGKIGICCIGGLNRATGPNKGVDNRTPAQIESQITLIRNILKRHPKAKVVGHRDLAATQCPGFDARQWWAKVQHQKRPAPAPVPKNAPVVTPGVDDGDGPPRKPAGHVHEPADYELGLRPKPAQRVPTPPAPTTPEKPKPAPTATSGGKTGIVAIVVAAVVGAGVWAATTFADWRDAVVNFLGF